MNEQEIIRELCDDKCLYCEAVFIDKHLGCCPMCGKYYRKISELTFDDKKKVIEKMLDDYMYRDTTQQILDDLINAAKCDGQESIKTIGGTGTFIDGFNKGKRDGKIEIIEDIQRKFGNTAMIAVDRKVIEHTAIYAPKNEWLSWRQNHIL